jgi:serine/threonine protein kinase/Tol biopolymer transport system component
MTLAAGARLGPYEILSPLGAGGMGEVYRARDTRLGRDVAVKVLPAHLSTDPERRERFEREAKAVSSLSHPHICALHDVGREGEVDYLVMELLEGETLQDRLARGALSTEQVLRYGAEIGDALDAAHRKGIVHRDLKPGNVMLTRTGVKLLDFGLARAAESAASPSGLTALPTVAGNLTQEGTILGTFQYMAPEQLEGKPADTRTDIFALGAVLYEMATGQKAFSGQSQASLIAAILEREPAPVSSIQPMTPPALERAIRSCLAKDPEDRWQSAKDVASELRWIGQASSQPGTPAPALPSRARRERLWMAVAGVAVGVSAVLVWASSRARPTPPTAILHFSIITPADVRIENTLAVSPDGKQIVFVATPLAGGEPHLWVRAIDSQASRLVEGTEGARFPFWAPDGRAVAFFANGKLKRAPLSGGVPQSLCDVPDSRGGTWGSRGDILFTLNANDAIYRVSEDGGPVTRVTTVDSARGETSHRWPAFLTDGKRFLALVLSNRDETQGLSLFSLDGAPPRFLTHANSSPGVVPGFLLWGSPALQAQAFDERSGTLVGTPASVVDRVARSANFNGLSCFSASQTGLLVYRPGGLGATQFTWFDRDGKPIAAVGDVGNWTEPALSPDGTRVVAGKMDADHGNVTDLWILDLDRGAWSRLTFDPGDEVTPVWSRDGKDVFSSTDKGITRFSAGTGTPEVLLEAGKDLLWVDDTSPDGRTLLYERTDPKSKWDLWMLDLGTRKAHPFLVTPANESHSTYSPDGRFVAYVSDETGRGEIYVQPADGSQGRWQISTAGGDQPQWPRGGNEIIFVGPGGVLMTAEISTLQGFEVRPPRRLFAARIQESGVTGYRNAYVVADGGRRFLINVPQEEGSRLDVVVNWPATLKPR